MRRPTPYIGTPHTHDPPHKLLEYLYKRRARATEIVSSGDPRGLLQRLGWLRQRNRYGDAGVAYRRTRAPARGRGQGRAVSVHAVRSGAPGALPRDGKRRVLFGEPGHSARAAGVNPVVPAHGRAEDAEG